MTNSARITVDLEFADGKTRTIQPLTIKRLRRFMHIVEQMNTTGTSLKDEDINKMMDAASVVMEQADPALADDKDALEEALDVDVFWKIMQVAMGNKLADPNE